MNKKERVINALKHIETDIIPYHADFTGQELEKILALENGEDFLNKNDVHLNYCQYWGWPTELPEKPGYYKDDYGVVWNRNGADKDIGVVEEFVIPEPDISYWKEPVIDEKRLRGDFEAVLKDKDDKFVFPGIGFSMFERAWSLCGIENILMYMLTDEDFVHQLLDTICDYNLKHIDIANEYDFDGFYFGDDWGQQKGLIMGPELWRKFIKPRMARMYARAKSGGKFIMQHSCGDIYEIFPDLIEIGLDCYQTFQPEIYDIEKVKNEFGSKLTFWGGISTQRLLPYATPEVVKSETARIMNILGKGGGYIAAPTHAVPFDVPPENIFAMFEVFNNQKKYLTNVL